LERSSDHGRQKTVFREISSSLALTARGALPVGAIVAVMAGSLLLPIQSTKAVPAFTDQTGLQCSACHVGGYGPQLTPMGRDFKLGGYTMRAKKNIPISGMAVASFVNTKKDQAPPPHYSSNDNFTLDEASIFLAGGIGNHFGGFSQVTYDGVERSWALDLLDLRAVTQGNLFGADATFGLTLNNGPQVQDAWNTLSAWGFPYTESGLQPGPDAELFPGKLIGNSLGLSSYAWINHQFYAEAGGYFSPSAGTVSWVGNDPTDPGNIHGIAPYGRFAYQTDLGGGTFELGAFAMKSAIYPARDMSAGLTDHYSDVGVDASWQKQTGSGDLISLQSRYTHERQNLRASCLIEDENSDCARIDLNEWRGDASYHWKNKLGATIGAFSISGDSNNFVYGGPNASPDSNGAIFQLDYSPWGDGNGPLGPRVNIQVGLQYTAYGKFNGAKHNYDGLGSNASDNNTLRIYTWLAF